MRDFYASTSDTLDGELDPYAGTARLIKILAVHFLRILQWWGKTAKGPIFLALPPRYNAIADGVSRVPQARVN